jgi:hypothetical protein
MVRMMHDKKISNLVIGFGIVLSFFAIPHLIDDFLFGIPTEFGMSNQTAQILSGLFIAVWILILVIAARGQRIGYYGTAIMGMFLALAGILKHIPIMILTGSYWSGWFSETLIYGLILTGLLLFCGSIFAIRNLQLRTR